MAEIRNNWTFEEIKEIYDKPLLELVFEAATAHRKYHNPKEVQVSSLISVKTGGCPEDCAYCPQAARYHTDIKVHKLMEVEEVRAQAESAKANGASRMCLGAAWREVRDNRDFDKVLDMVKTVNSMDMEVCCTLGMVSEDQARKLADAGLYAYNHNIDTSEAFYGDIISTRAYDDRLKTIENVRKTGITVCSGGIIGMGESAEDRIGMLLTLANMQTHPESVPVNALVPVEGTPLAEQPRVAAHELIRMIATARLVMPASVVRLSAGREGMSLTEQALCFMAGANSIFAGDKLLTTPNPDFNDDREMFDLLGLMPREAFKYDKREAEVEHEQLSKSIRREKRATSAAAASSPAGGH
ncbi:MAG: biotin synthase BioB [Ekhidna sp.]|nr:biotin synthase BioB [Ekhidna sp.]MBC6410487.1 biotin synthase BioB [Ekhidna sp.]MBC6427154.1 biotin synthase BioB [Ekhidna sp.]